MQKTNAQLFGRAADVAILDKLLESNQAELLALYGRRRVGKTYLIRETFDNRKQVLFFNVTGSKQGDMKEQITHFTKELGRVFYQGAPLEISKNWDQTFELLTNAINKVDPTIKIVLFFDELPWLATRNSRLLSALDYYWNQYWSRDRRIKLIVCGSSASWIIKKIINNNLLRLLNKVFQ